MLVGNASSSASGGTKLQIGDWTVEPALNQLSAAGRGVKLEPKAMSVLVYLADRPGQVVSREALLSAVWPGVVVSDDALTQVVIKLRKALGDAPEKPAYIQTISKGGYRLIAPVTRMPESPPAFSPSADDLAGRKRRMTLMAGASLAALLLAGAGAWWIKGGAINAVPPAATARAGADRAMHPTVATKAFEVLGDDPRAILLARGITADLATDLSKVFGLWVIGAVPVDGQEGGELPTRAPPIHYLVSGSVQRVDDRLRLHVYLTDVQTGKRLWSERFDRASSGLFAIQEELGPKLLRVLPAKVSEAEMRRVAQRYTSSLEAYEYFQRGRAALLIRRRAQNEAAREMFRRAISLDAGFARAYAGLALTYAADYRNQWTEVGAAALDRAFNLARTAYQLNPDIPESYWVLASRMWNGVSTSRH